MAHHDGGRVEDAVTRRLPVPSGPPIHVPAPHRSTEATTVRLPAPAPPPAPLPALPPARPRDAHARLAYAPGLDGLRAIAVTAVVLYHLGTTGLGMAAPGGFLGVDVFFVLSGYLITSLLLAERAASGRISIRRFYVRRARRLLPALYTMLAVVAVAAGFWFTDYAARLRGDLVAALTYVTNWWLIAGGSSYFGAGTHPPLLTHLWSLALEEQFYLLWPLLLVVLTRLRRRGPVIVLVGALVAASTVLAAALYDPYADPSRIYYGTDTRLATPLLGALIAITVGAWRRRPGLTGARAFLLAAAGVVALGGLGWAFRVLDDHNPFLYRGGFLAVATGAGLVTVAAAQPGGLGRVLGIAPLRWLGERSYAVYLWHWPIFAVTQPGINTSLSPLVSTLVRILGTLVVADLSYRLVEKPMRAGALGRGLARLRRPPRLGPGFAAAGLVVVALAGGVVVGQRLLAATAPSGVPVGPGPDLSLGALGGSPSPGSPAPSRPGSPRPAPSATGSATVPAHPPKVAVFGDSQGMTLLLNAPKDTSRYVKFTDDTLAACGLLRGKVSSRSGERQNLVANCPNWKSFWTDRARRDHPDIALIMIGAWDVFDLITPNGTLAFASAAWDANYTDTLDSAIDAIRPYTGHVAISLLPCYRPVHGSAGFWPERGDDDRTRHVNTLLTAIAAASGGYVTTVAPPHEFCDDPKISRDLNYRWDGVHYYKPGALLFCRAVIPQLLAVAPA